MATHDRDITVRLRDTDAAGVIYFTSLLVFAHETFEDFLDAGGLSLGRLLAGAEVLLPIVRCEADYRRAVTVGDRLRVEMSLAERGESSFALAYTLRRDGDEVGRCRIAHAAVDRRGFRPVPLPPEIRDHLDGLSPDAG